MDEEVQDPYQGREQTAVKHRILERYLERFAHIIGSRWSTLTYIDCFSGPWQAHSEELEDTSFSIALRQLRTARDTYKKRGRHLKLRCLFLEKDPTAYSRLKAFADRVTDAEVKTINSRFEDAISELVDFAQAGGRESFPFVFIDPKGWTGIAIRTIGPILRLQPGEVLINFMLDPIRRFIESPQEPTQQSFEDLFGISTYRDRLSGLRGQELEEEAIALYSDSLRGIGHFEYVCCATILYPEIDKTYFNLLYASRHFRGAQAFKEAEHKAMQLMEGERAKAAVRRRARMLKNRELFTDAATERTKHLETLRERYLDQARNRLREVVEKEGRITYERGWSETSRFPLVWERDMKKWLHGEIEASGLRPNQRTPKLGGGNYLIWKK